LVGRLEWLNKPFSHYSFMITAGEADFNRKYKLCPNRSEKALLVSLFCEHVYKVKQNRQ
jgi:hypothetical protein